MTQQVCMVVFEIETELSSISAEPIIFTVLTVNNNNLL